MPVEKEVPRPVIKTTLARSSASIVSTAWAKSASHCTLSALSLSGRLKTIRPARPSSWQSTVSRRRSAIELAPVDDSPRLTFGARQDPRRKNCHLDSQPDHLLDPAPGRLGQPVVAAAFLRFHQHLHLVVLLLGTVDNELVVACQARHREQQLLDLAWEDVDAAHLQHVVGPAADLQHPHERVAALARPVREDGQVPGAIAEDWRPPPGQARQDELALLAARDRLPGVGVDRLREEVVFEDVEPVVLVTLNGHAGPAQLRQSVDVESLQSEPGLDLAAHAVGPGFGAEEAGPELQLPPHVQLA